MNVNTVFAIRCSEGEECHVEVVGIIAILTLDGIRCMGLWLRNGLRGCDGDVLDVGHSEWSNIAEQVWTSARVFTLKEYSIRILVSLLKEEVDRHA